MQVQSAFASGVQGLQRSEQALNEASAAIARQPVEQQQQQRNVESPQPQQTTASSTAESRPVTDELVKLRLAERDAQASSKVIQTADQAVGSLIDTRA